MITRRRTGCYRRGELTIANGVELSSDNEFLSENRIKTECDEDCSARSICLTIVKRLEKEDWKGAEILIDTLIKED